MVDSPIAALVCGLLIPFTGLQGFLINKQNHGGVGRAQRSTSYAILAFMTFIIIGMIAFGVSTGKSIEDGVKEGEINTTAVKSGIGSFILVTLSYVALGILLPMAMIFSIIIAAKNGGAK